MKDLVPLLNQSNHNTLIFQLNKPLLGSSEIDLPIELRSPRKGLTNIQNEDQK